jgi:hypothetical protein
VLRFRRLRILGITGLPFHTFSNMAASLKKKKKLYFAFFKAASFRYPNVFAYGYKTLSHGL